MHHKQCSNSNPKVVYLQSNPAFYAREEGEWQNTDLTLDLTILMAQQDSNLLKYEFFTELKCIFTVFTDLPTCRTNAYQGYYS